MRRVSFLFACVVLVALPRVATSQAPAAPAATGLRPSDVVSMDSILHALYDVISGPAGQARDWNRFRALFVPDARLIPTANAPGRAAVLTTLTVDQYAERAGANLEKNGFFEREVARTAARFGGIVQAFSTYESRRHADDPTPFARGINSIQLWFDGQRWWVVTIYWEAERPGNPIPAEYLPK